jgi:hypothetical protein
VGPAARPTAKNYLNFLVDRIVVHDGRIEIEAKPLNSLAMMAASPELAQGRVDRPEAVLTKGGDWLRK